MCGVTHKTLRPVQIATITDPIDRLRACTEFLNDYRRAIDDVILIRDETIRRLAADGMSRTQIALKSGVSLNVVIDTLRNPPRGARHR